MDASASERTRLEVILRYDHGIDDVRRVFAHHSISADVRGAAPFMDPNEVLFKAAATILVVGPLKAFREAFASEAGKAAYVRLHEFLRDLRAARGDRVVLLHDRERVISVRIEHNTPDDARSRLFDLDLAAFEPRHTLDWDERARTWVPRKARQRRSDGLRLVRTRAPG